MQIPRTKSLASIASLLFIVFALTPSAKADNYALYALEVSSGSIDNIGLTADGTLVMYVNGENDYITFTAPSAFVTSVDLPPLTFSNGTACTPDASGFTYISQGICNNGYEAFYGRVGTSVTGALYDGPSPADVLYGGYIDNILIDPIGDIAFVSVDNSQYSGDVNFLAIDLTSRATPEPSSLALLGTTLLAAVALLRKKSLLTRI